jgi:protein dithiol:quinone oxidoreductase
MPLSASHPPGRRHPIRLSPALLLGGTAAASVAAVSFAMAAQHVFGMEPCPWCVLQRAIFLAIALLCLLAMAWRGRMLRALAAGLGLLLAGSGAAAALWQHFVAAKSDSCAISLAERIVAALRLDTLWPDAFLAGASCGDAAATLLGIPFPFYSLALFALIALACAAVIVGTLRTPRPDS